MAEEERSAGKYSFVFGNVTHSQFVTGDYNTVAQRIGLTPEETAELESLFARVRTTVEEQAEPEQREEALAKAAELESAVLAEQPDPGRIRSVLRWFRDYAPQLLGTVVSTVASPVVGKVVEAAGEAIADQFREVVEEESG